MSEDPGRLYARCGGGEDDGTVRHVRHDEDCRDEYGGFDPEVDGAFEEDVGQEGCVGESGDDARDDNDDDREEYFRTRWRIRRMFHVHKVARSELLEAVLIGNVKMVRESEGCHVEGNQEGEAPTDHHHHDGNCVLVDRARPERQHAPKQPVQREEHDEEYVSVGGPVFDVGVPDTPGIRHGPLSSLSHQVGHCQRGWDKEGPGQIFHINDHLPCDNNFAKEQS